MDVPTTTNTLGALTYATPCPKSVKKTKFLVKSAEESGATALLLKMKIRKKTNKKIKKKINKKKSKIREAMTKIMIKIKMENLVVEVVIYKSVDVLTTSCSLGALKLIKFRVLGVI